MMKKERDVSKHLSVLAAVRHMGSFVCEASGSHD